MTLKDYFKTLSVGSKTEMCNKIGISRTWLSLIISGRKVPSAPLCNLIQRYTNGKVTRAELRPDLFGDV
jgi:DNA-binding transcriptional regulator YdaS (Cro superfamily)